MDVIRKLTPAGARMFAALFDIDESCDAGSAALFQADHGAAGTIMELFPMPFFQSTPLPSPTPANKKDMSPPVSAASAATVVTNAATIDSAVAVYATAPLAAAAAAPSTTSVAASLVSRLCAAVGVRLSSPVADEPVARLVGAADAGIGVNSPHANDEGSGVTASWILRDTNGNAIGVFKPAITVAAGRSGGSCDGGSRCGSGCTGGSADYARAGIPANSGWLRERAAYLLDSQRHFHSVPPTALVTAQAAGQEEAVNGSLMQWVPHECDGEEMSPSLFPVDEVHRIGLLDLRILNNDRHAGNILVKRRASLDASDAAVSSLQLIPIDHSLSLPSYPNLGEAWFDWLNWRQSRQPFGAEARAYVASLDVEADISLLRQDLGPLLDDGAIKTLRVTTLLLQAGVAAGRTLYELGSMVSRPIGRGAAPSSRLEQLCTRAESDAAAAAGDAVPCDAGEGLFLEHLTALLLAEFAGVSPC